MRNITKSSIGTLVLIAGISTPASAQLINLGSFSPDADSIFQFINSGSGSTFSSVGTLNGTFKFLVPNAYNNMVGTPTSTDIAAQLTLTSRVSGTATLTSTTTGTNLLLQPISLVSLNISALTPLNGKNNLLTLTGSGNLVGAADGANLFFYGDNKRGDVVNFSSDFQNFVPGNQETFNFGFTAVRPSLAIESNQYLSSFTTGGVGVFAADFNANPSVSPTPEASTFALIAAPGFMVGVILLRRRMRKA